MNISRLKSHVPYIIAIFFVILLLVYLYHNAERYRKLLDLSALLLLGLMGLVLVFTLSNGLNNYLFYRGLGVPLTLNEGIGLAAINTLANQLPFAGGLIAKGLYLKQRYELAYARFLSATLALYLCFISVNGFIGVGVLTHWAFAGETGIPPLLFIAFALMSAVVLMLWVPINAKSPPGKWGKILEQMVIGWRFLGQSKILVVELACLQAFMTLVFAGRFWIAFHAVSQHVTMSQCILFAAATILTRLVSISPGGLGIREALVAGVATLLGFDPGVSVVAVAIDRLVAALVVMVMGTVYAYVLGKKAAVASKPR